MYGKVVQLLGKKQSNGFEVVYGIDNHIANRYLLGFGEIILKNSNPGVTTTYMYGGYDVKRLSDGYKKLTIYNGELPKDSIVDQLLVIIPRAEQIITSATRIAGRYYNEAILEMRDGDTVEVSKNKNGESEVYTAVQKENEIYLVNKTN